MCKYWSHSFAVSWMSSQKDVCVLIFVNTTFIYVSKGFHSVMWWVSVLLALLNSMGLLALYKPFLTFRIGWTAGYREMSSTTCLHLAWGLFLRKMGKWLLSDMCSLHLHTPELLETSHCFWVYLKGRVVIGETFLSVHLPMVWCLTGNLMVINDMRWVPGLKSKSPGLFRLLSIWSQMWYFREIHK